MKSTNGLRQFAKQLEQLSAKEKDEFYVQCLKELAARFLAKVIKRTPALSGTLRRGWTNVNNIHVIKVGKNYQVTIANYMNYASYVEYGHRQEVGRYVPAIGKRLTKGWVPGKFMMTISAKEVETEKQEIIEQRLAKFLKEALHVT